MTIEEHLYMGKIACITGSIALAGPSASLAPLPGRPPGLRRYGLIEAFSGLSPSRRLSEELGYQLLGLFSRGPAKSPDLPRPLFGRG
jgi:hypothetical protein